jgi:hypothetical protein
VGKDLSDSDKHLKAWYPYTLSRTFTQQGSNVNLQKYTTSIKITFRCELYLAGGHQGGMITFIWPTISPLGNPSTPGRTARCSSKSASHHAAPPGIIRLRAEGLHRLAIQPDMIRS